MFRNRMAARGLALIVTLCSGCAMGAQPTWAYCMGTTLDSSSAPQAAYFSVPFRIYDSEDAEAASFKACVQRSFPEVQQFEFDVGCNNTRTSYEDAEGMGVQFRITRDQHMGIKTVQTACHPG